MIIQNLLRAGRAGAHQLELILPSTNKASQSQHVFAPKDTDFVDVQPIEDVLPCADGWRLENTSTFPTPTGNVDFHSLQAVDSSISTPSSLSSSNRGGSFYFGCPNVPSFYSQPEWRVGSTSLSEITRNFASGSRPTGFVSANQATQSAPSYQAFAQLGPAPLIVGTMWMPVLWPVFQGNTTFPNAAIPENPTTAINSSSMNQHPAVAAWSTQIEEGKTQTKAPSKARVRRQRGAKKVAATETEIKNASVTEELCRPQISGPALRRESSETSSTVSSTDAGDSIHTSTRSLTPPTSESRMESWADARDDDDESHDSALVRAAGISSPSDAEVDPMLLDLDCGDESKQKGAIEWVIGSVYPLAVTRRGCRIVQRALEVATSADQQRIADKLRGHVEDMLTSPNANHVLQKCVEVMPPEKTQFIVDELQGHGAFAARHRFGCRILQRLIEHCLPTQTEELVKEILSEAPKLIRHQYGNFVIQHILQHGSPDQLHEIACALRTDVIRLAKHRIASHVVSCAMVHCLAEDVQSLTQVVLGEAGQLADLSRRQYGSFVVREVHRATRLNVPANV
jgi:hypothetical protein